VRIIHFFPCFSSVTRLCIDLPLTSAQCWNAILASKPHAFYVDVHGKIPDILLCGHSAAQDKVRISSDVVLSGLRCHLTCRRYCALNQRY
jgi:hypothetical protein